jgi:lipoate-protein ligase A
LKIKPGGNIKSSWRLVFSGGNDSFFNMALDEVLLLACQNQDSVPILRLYQWVPPGISLGYFQSLEKTIDLKKCHEKGIDFVRRITGGRAVLHENEITYSICASEKYYDKLGKNVSETYRNISFAFIQALRFLNIQADWVKPHKASDNPHSNFSVAPPCFASTSRYEITVQGKKLIGSAQRRFKNCFIQHGSLLLGKGRLDLLSFLPLSDKEKERKTILEKSTSLEEILNQKIILEKVIEAIQWGFENFFEVNFKEKRILEKEKLLAIQLKKEKYSTEGWNC